MIVETDIVTGNKFITTQSIKLIDIDIIVNKWKPLLYSDIGVTIVDDYCRKAMACMLEQQQNQKKIFTQYRKATTSTCKWMEPAKFLYDYSLPLIRRYIKLNIDWKQVCENDSSIKWVKSSSAVDLNILYTILRTDFIDPTYDMESFLGDTMYIKQIAPLIVIDDGIFYRFN